MAANGCMSQSGDWLMNRTHGSAAQLPADAVMRDVVTEHARRVCPCATILGGPRQRQVNALRAKLTLNPPPNRHAGSASRSERIPRTRMPRECRSEERRVGKE